MPFLLLYLVKVIICSAVLFGYYYLFLRNKIYHIYNRFYLLATVVIALFAPLINFQFLLAENDEPAKPIQLLQAVSNGNEYLEEIVIRSSPAQMSADQVLLIVYMIISALVLLALLRMIGRIAAILRTSVSRRIEDFVFVESEAKGTPFSFFKYIFWNKNINLEDATGKQIFAHELAHVRENHSMDKLFLNLALVFAWINPVFWLIKKELTLIHEFIADKKAVANHDASSLAAMIVRSAYPAHPFILTNHFFYSPIKRRLQMLSKYNNAKAGYLYRVLALPVILLLVAAFTLKMKKDNSIITSPAKKITVVIDAGHGGKDAGAMATDGTQEKELNLIIAKKIKEAADQIPNIEVVLTRSDDVYQTPNEKAALAKSMHADMLVSVHLATSSKPVTDISGFAVYVAKPEYENSKASEVLASAIINHFRNNYDLQITNEPQQRSMSIAILQQNSFPSVLIEAGYINNPGDLAFLKSAKGQQQIAANILRAIVSFAANKTNTIALRTSFSPADTTPTKHRPSDLGKYMGKNIKSITITSSNTQEKKFQLRLEDGETVALTEKEAKLAGLTFVPPPPPPPPPAPASPANASAPPAPPAPPAAPKNAAPKPPPPPPAPAVNRDGEYVTDASERKNAATRALSTTGDPLYILNNKEITAQEMKSLNPDVISSINVLKDASAIEKYGKEKGSNGVIEISSKGGVDLLKKPQQDDNKVFMRVEQEAKFPGDMYAWHSYIQKKIDSDVPIREGWAPGIHTVIVRFIVSSDGSLSDIVAENFSDSKTAQMCINAIKNGPKWIPAKQNGKIVNAYKKQPFTFVITKS